MQEYRGNKLRTVMDIVKRIENWPTAMDMRLRRHRQAGPRLLRFRSGLNVVCRSGTHDWDVVHELLFAGSYTRAMQFLKVCPGKPVVLDLGANIGLFSLLAASANPQSEVHAFEPGPPNYRLLEINRLMNPELGGRLHLHQNAVGGQTRMVEWTFDSENPGGSGLYAVGTQKFAVQILSFFDVMAALGQPPDLVKIDIEGAEFELLAATPPETWRPIKAISLELHGDPAGKMSNTEFWNRIKAYGFKVEEESVCSFFLHR